MGRGRIQLYFLGRPSTTLRASPVSTGVREQLALNAARSQRQTLFVTKAGLLCIALGIAQVAQ